MTRIFRDLLQGKWDEHKFVSVGLDTDTSRLPSEFRTRSDTDGQLQFNRKIIDSTANQVCAYKPNLAFYEALGVSGITNLQTTIAYIRANAPTVPIIVDAKRADIGNTNSGYVQFIFDYLGADAVTVHPYLGREALEPFLSRDDKGILVLCRTSNPGAGEFQDLSVDLHGVSTPLYQVVAHQVALEWNSRNNCGLVVGATYPNELAAVRQIVGDIPILVPGVGDQGGDLRQAVLRGRNSNRQGVIINASRSIIFRTPAEDFAIKAAVELERMNGVITRSLKDAA